jgi:hypothetical protein
VSAWLAAAYGALALGLAWMLTSRPDWWLRASYIVCAPVLALGLWLGRPDTAGWPSTAKMPSQSSLLWAVVDEPDPALSDPGHIYLWLDVGSPSPRAYVLPYSRQLHEQVQRALASLQKQRPVEVSRTTARPSSGRPSRRSGQQQTAGLQFRPGRLPQLPVKAADRGSG